MLVFVLLQGVVYSASHGHKNHALVAKIRLESECCFHSLSIYINIYVYYMHVHMCTCLC